jgi:hypothetical protein
LGEGRAGAEWARWAARQWAGGKALRQLGCGKADQGAEGGFFYLFLLPFVLFETCFSFEFKFKHVFLNFE